MLFLMIFNVDGGCRNNGYDDAYGAAAAIDSPYSKTCTARTRRLEKGTWPRPSNQRAEITAIIIALEWALESYKELSSEPYLDVTIKSDSKYAVGCMTDWIYKWSRNGWRNRQGNEVANKDLIQYASSLDDEVAELGKIKYKWVPRSLNRDADRECDNVLEEMESEMDNLYRFCY